ncbi:hypothetical protein NKG05_27690 [Oerskovia sp. M15]
MTGQVAPLDAMADALETALAPSARGSETSAEQERLAHGETPQNAPTAAPASMNGPNGIAVRRPARPWRAG